MAMIGDLVLITVTISRCVVFSLLIGSIRELKERGE